MDDKGITPLEKFTKSQQEFLTCKPSRLIHMALTDLLYVEKSKKYEVDMSQWLRQETRWEKAKPVKVCYVCLAGAAVSRRFKIYDGGIEIYELERTIIDGHAEEVSNRMEALNMFRVGQVTEAISYLKLFPDDIKTINKIDKLTEIYKVSNDETGIPEYCHPDENPKRNQLFKTRLSELAVKLEKLGL